MSKLVIWACVTGLGIYGGLTTAAAQNEQADCVLAKRYYRLAQDKRDQFDDVEATLYLKRAADACASYAYFQELGELSMKGFEDEDKVLAADAFVNAHSLARTDKERSRTLWKYAGLLNQEGDPQNADRLIREAKRLDGSNEEIANLATEIEHQIQNPTKEQLVRGLQASLYKSLVVVTVPSITGDDGSAAETPSPARLVDGQPSVNIPINFEFNSTRVNSGTRRNIALLASTLMESGFSSQKFEFVGHADTRGSPQQNRVLSKQRAYAIYEAVVDLAPNLKGRIVVSGRGADDPIDFGSTEQAHRANRRLQVLLQ